VANDGADVFHTCAVKYPAQEIASFVQNAENLPKSCKIACIFLQKVV
jgi:hypothetical protein